MRYRDDATNGNKLSALGYGCMRFPRGVTGRIDLDKTEKLVLSAIDRGVNYFDTAYNYMGSEQALGEVIGKNPGIREKMYIATKLPHGSCGSRADFDRIFAEQLRRLRVDFVDYYLMHNLQTLGRWEELRGMGIEEWIAGKKAEGKIGRVGFSFHGTQAEFMGILAAYDWDFCQIQYNYMNEHYQAGTEGLDAASAKGIPVIVMEPLLGGKLANPPKKAQALFREGEASPANLALRWLWDHEGVTVVLSGMGNMQQLEENAAAADTAEAGCLTEAEVRRVRQVMDIFEESYSIPCTGCNYCLPCPKGVHIPGCFAAYNTLRAAGFIAGMQQYMTGTGAINPEANGGARNCVKCGACEKKCPQHIEIIKSLEIVGKKMEPAWIRAGLKLYHRLSK